MPEPKRRPGRPKKPAGELRNRRTRVYFNKLEETQLALVAQLSGKERAVFAREAVLEAMDRVLRRQLGNY